MELASQLIITKELGFVSEERYNELRLKFYEISNKLNALHKYQLSNSTVKRFNRA